MRKNTDPLRKVVDPQLRVSTCIGMDAAGSPKFYFWDLHLECGHDVERRCRYKPGGDTGWGRIWHGSNRDAILEPPKRARCEFCASEKRSAAMVYVVHDLTKSPAENPAFGPMTEEQADALVEYAVGTPREGAYWKQHISAGRTA